MKTIKLNAQLVYSKYEQLRTAAGEAEIKYLYPSKKRIDEIQNYAIGISTSDNVDLPTRRKANLLFYSCEQELALRSLLKQYKDFQEGKL